MRDSLGELMLVREMLADPVLDDQSRGVALLAMLYADPAGVLAAVGEEGIARFMAETCWECFRLDVDGGHACDAASRAERERGPLVDLEEDGPRIWATFRAAYGLSPEQTLDLPYTEAMALLGQAPRETPMGQALYYRTAERPRATRWNSEERRAFDECRRLYALHGHGGDDDGNDAATAAFAAMREAVVSGGRG